MSITYRALHNISDFFANAGDTIFLKLFLCTFIILFYFVDEIKLILLFWVLMLNDIIKLL